MWQAIPLLSISYTRSPYCLVPFLSTKVVIVAIHVPWNASTSVWNYCKKCGGLFEVNQILTGRQCKNTLKLFRQTSTEERKGRAASSKKGTMAPHRKRNVQGGIQKATLPWREGKELAFLPSCCLEARISSEGSALASRVISFPC